MKDKLTEALYENLWDFCKLIEDKERSKMRSNNISLDPLKAGEVKSTIIAMMKHARKLEASLEMLQVRRMGEYLERMEEIDNGVDFDCVADFPEVRRLKEEIKRLEELSDIYKEGAKEELKRHKEEKKLLVEEIERLKDSMGAFRPLFTEEDDSSVTL